MSTFLSPRRARATLVRSRYVAAIATIALTSACTDSATRSLVSPPAAVNDPVLLASEGMSRADSQSAGYFSPSRRGLRPGVASLALIGGMPNASVANAIPGWYQGAAQPQTISASLNGPVNSVTVSGSGAIMCSGAYGTLIAYDKAGTVLGSSPLSLLDPADCGYDEITYGATATVTVTSGVIARFDITPMSPLVFQTASRASATYAAWLGVYASSDYPPYPLLQGTCDKSSLLCTFDASNSKDDFGIASYTWDLVNPPNSAATGANVSTTYPGAGWRRMRLTLTDTKGQTSRLLRWVGPGVGLPPGQPPQFKLAATCVGLTCTFTDNAVASTPELYRTWDIGNGLYYLNNVASPTITFPAAGFYGVGYKLADGEGVYVIGFTSVNVGGPPPDAPPVASFTVNCIGQSYPHQCTFVSTSTDDVGIVSYRWDWGNGRSETKTVPTTRNTWAAAGVYSVTLLVTDTKGQTGTVTVPVTVP